MELRLKIFECVLRCPPAGGRSPPNSFTTAQPALTRVNNKIRDESLPIFYNENRFMIKLHDLVDRCDRSCNDQSSFCAPCRHLKMLGHFSETTTNGPGTSILAFIRNIDIVLCPSINGDCHTGGDQWMWCIRMRADKSPEPPISTVEERHLIGDKEVDWTSPEGVREAFLSKHPRWRPRGLHQYRYLDEHRDMEEYERHRQKRYISITGQHWVLIAALAKECPLATDKVYLEFCPVEFFRGAGGVPID